MFKNYIIIVCSSIGLLLIACRKDNRTPLPDASVVFQQGSGGDTMQLSLAPQDDSLVFITVMAKISGKVTSNSDHWVEFAADSTQMDTYRAKYGDALLLPSDNYSLYNPMVKIGAGASVSDTGMVNLFGETKLKPDTTYVLPLVIKTVDGNMDGAASRQVLYLVIKMGKAAFLDKSGWTISAFSSCMDNIYYSCTPDKLLDNDETSMNSSWASDPYQPGMPQYVTINFNSDLSFKAVNYTLSDWTTTYPDTGGFPTYIKLETSMDGTTWIPAVGGLGGGIFAAGDPVSNIVNRMQTIVIGQTTARYLRFTVLAAQPWVGVNALQGLPNAPTSAYINMVFLGGIRLVP